MIFVDDRDGSNELIPLLPDCTPCRLDAGDVAIAGNGPDGDVLVGVEVKKMDDLLKSISSGRLGDIQLEPLVDNYYQAWLLTIGSYRAGRSGELQLRGSRGNYYPYRIGNRPVPMGYVEAMLVELQALGLHHKHVYSNEDAARWIATLGRWWCKPWSQHRGLRKFHTQPVRLALMPERDPVEDQIARVVKELPGLGWERAWAAAGEFESIDEALNAPLSRWATIAGIGKVLAKTTVEAIKRRKHGA